MIRQRHAETPPVAACRWCGFDKYAHEGRWVPSRGWHDYAPPTVEQVRARLAARFGAVQWKRSTW